MNKYNWVKAMILAIVITAFFCLGLVLTHGYTSSYTVQNIEPPIIKEDITKNPVLNKLAFFESTNGKFRKILDCNDRYSLGLYHFQARTVQDMYRRYYHKKISIDEAVKVAENDTLSSELAYQAIFVKGETWHWHNSMVKMNKLGLITYN